MPLEHIKFKLIQDTVIVPGHVTNTCLVLVFVKVFGYGNRIIFTYAI